jgi:RecB family endonuclease NucS
MDITANELTQWAKKYLETQGVRLNRVNNIPWAKRKGTIEKGWPDLQGYDKNGTYFAVEVKKIGDKISLDQKNRLEDIWICEGISLICTEQDGKPILILWEEARLLQNFGKMKK